MILQHVPKGLLLIILAINFVLFAGALRDAVSKRGLRPAVFFFIFAILYSGRHIISRTPLLSASDDWVFRSFFDDRGFWQLMKSTESFSAGLYIIINNLFLWVFVLYSSLSVAEQIIKRIKSARGRIFPLILMSALTMTFLVVMLQWGQSSTARAAGLNTYKVIPAFSDMFFFASSGDSVKRAFFFAIYFYAAFYFFEYSALRNKLSRWIFLFALINLHPALEFLFGRGTTLLYEHIAVLSALLFLALKSPLQLMPPTPEDVTPPVRGGLVILLAVSIFFGMAYHPSGLPDALPFICLYLFSFGFLKIKYAFLFIVLFFLGGISADSLIQLLPALIPLITAAVFILIRRESA